MRVTSKIDLAHCSVYSFYRFNFAQAQAQLCTFLFFIYVQIEHFQSAVDAIHLSLSWLRADLTLLLLLLHRLNHHLTRCLIRELIWKSAFEDGRETRNKT